MKVHFVCSGAPTGKPERETVAQMSDEDTPIGQMFSLSQSKPGAVIQMVEGEYRRTWTLLEDSDG